jgi:hypothetical protein
VGCGRPLVASVVLEAAATGCSATRLGIFDEQNKSNKPFEFCLILIAGAGG